MQIAASIPSSNYIYIYTTGKNTNLSGNRI